jgi:hypothetical protein
MSRPIEQLFNPMLRGQLVTKASSATVQWAGKASIASGDATIVVSITNVSSDALIFISEQLVTDASSGVNLRSLCVKSITDGSYFTIGTTDGKGATRGRTVAWLMLQTK